jgi:hypothetical protein
MTGTHHTHNDRDRKIADLKIHRHIYHTHRRHKAKVEARPCSSYYLPFFAIFRASMLHVVTFDF